MAVAQLIQAWRVSRGYSVDDLAVESHLQPHLLEEIEAGEVDPSASLLEALADALKIPPAWLFSHPTSFQILFDDPEEDTNSIPSSPDPVIERILAGSRNRPAEPRPRSTRPTRIRRAPSPLPTG